MIDLQLNRFVFFFSFLCTFNFTLGKRKISFFFPSVKERSFKTDGGLLFQQALTLSHGPVTSIALRFNEMEQQVEWLRALRDLSAEKVSIFFFFLRKKFN